MKIQDVVFVIILLLALWRHHLREIAGLGLMCLILAISFFYLRIFYTAQRLVSYSLVFFLLSVVFALQEERRRGK